MQKITKNIFTGGMNTDVDATFAEGTTYNDARNVTLTAPGKGGYSASKQGNFLTLKPIAGTTELSTILTSGDSNIWSNQKILGIFINNYSINNAKIKGFTVFLYNTYTREFKIILVIKETGSGLAIGDKVTLYQETFDATKAADFLAADPIIEGVSYSEDGLDTLYFTDNYHEIRKIRCDIGNISFFTPFSETDLSVLRRATYAEIYRIDQIEPLNPITGQFAGTLLCGSYQYAVRLFNNNNSTYTKFTLLTNPVACHNTPNNSSKSTAGIGQSSNLTNRLQIRITTDEAASYTHFQVAVVENILALENAATEATLLTPSQISSGVTTYEYDHSSNKGIGSIPLADLVVDRAAIKAVRTLQIKNNRLFAGNISYHDLEYDNGNPAVTTGSILTGTISPDKGYDYSANFNRIGYFRDEVYRFAISYFDEYYNFSRPKVLDMSAVTNNKISATATDLKFPKRSDGNQWSLLETNDLPRALGLNISVDNHPTWAKGFVILRAKRIKNILFQTPFVPVDEIIGMKADGNYPTTYHEHNDLFINSSEGTSDPSASPNNPLGTLLPKNLFLPVNTYTTYKTNIGVSRQIMKTPSGTSLPSTKPDILYYRMIFPHSTMLDFSNDLTNSNKAFQFRGNETFELIDIAQLKLKFNTAGGATEVGPSNNRVTVHYNAGDFLRTTVDGTFYAITNSDYYYDANYTPGKDFDKFALTQQTGKINDYEVFDNLSGGGVVAGKWFGTYDHLQTSSSWGTPNDNMKCAVVKLTNPSLDIMYYSNPNTSSAPNALSTAGGAIPTSIYSVDNYTTPASEGSPLSNKFIHVRPGWTTSEYANAVEIVNITDGLTDLRYGPANTNHELISTGAYHVFNTTELTDVEAGTSLPINKDVWGGDCYINLCNYKLTNGHYGISYNGQFTGEAENVAWLALGGNPADTTNSVHYDTIYKWDRDYISNAASGTGLFANAPMSVPVPLDAVSTVLSVYVESEYNLNVQDSNEYNADPNEDKIFSYSGSTSQARQPFSYLYNININKANDQKIFIPFQEFESNKTSFNSRIAFSNQRIYQSDLTGFDVFNALDFYDLDEAYGEITSLVRAGNDMFSVQENAISYVPIDAQVLETADANTLSVNTAQVINRPVYVTTTNGAKHPSLVQQAPSSFFFFDTVRKNLMKVSGISAPVSVSDNGFINGIHELSNPSLASYDYRLMYDNVRGEVIVGDDGDYSAVFNEKYGFWTTRLGFNTTNGGGIHRGIGTDDELYIIGQNVNNFYLSSMYTNHNSRDYLGGSNFAGVWFVVNPEIEFSKVFDNVIIHSTDNLNSLTIRTPDLFNYDYISQSSLDFTPLEGSYRLKILRDTVTGARMRGHSASMFINWLPDNFSELSSVVTKYRISQRKV